MEDRDTVDRDTVEGVGMCGLHRDSHREARPITDGVDGSFY